FSYSGNDLDALGEPGFDQFHDERHAARMTVTVLAVGLVVAGILVAALVRYVLPWLLRSWSPTSGRSWVSLPRWRCWSSWTAGGGPGSSSSSGKASATLPGGSAASGGVGPG